MKKMIHTLGYVDDNDDIVIMGIVHTENTEKLVRFTLGEEVTARLIESSKDIPPDLISSIFKGEADE